MATQVSSGVTLAQDAAARDAVYQFRYDVYVREMGKLGTSGADHATGRLIDPEDAHADLYVATGADGGLIGTLRVATGDHGVPAAFRGLPGFDRFAEFPPEAMSFTSRLMVAPGARGGAAMNALVGAAYRAMLDSPVQVDFCACVPGLVDLYEHLGYRRFTENVVDPVVGYQVPLALVLRDAEHLEAIRSPLWRLLRGHPTSGEGGAVAAWLRETFPMTSVVRDWVENEGTFWHFLAEKVRDTASGRASILADLDEGEQRRMFRSGTVLDCRKGDVIIPAGTVGKEIYVVLDGVVEVRLPDPDMTLAVLDTGQVFGEIAFITDATRSADVVAMTDARLLVLTQAYLRKLMKASPDLAAKLLLNLSRVLAERVVTGNRRRTAEAD
ncbi:MAG: cyclic nucleotide-binding domain-containing protein [Rhodospirillaceae bacterium]